MKRSDLRTMSEINRQIAIGDRGAVAFDDDIELATKDKTEKKQSKEEENVEADENRMGSSTTKEDRMGSSTTKEKSSTTKDENRRKSSDFWLLWPQPSTRASMARFALLPIVTCYKKQTNQL